MIPRKFEILFSERKTMKDDLIHIDLELIVFDILQVSKKISQSVLPIACKDQINWTW